MALHKITSNQGWLFANIFKLLGLFYLLFLLSRLGLVLAYPEDFQQLSAAEIGYALLRGALHFDTSITLLFIGLPLLLTLLPFRWPTTRWWHRLVGWYGFLLFNVFLFVLIADGLYFGQVHRHVGQELAAAMKTDPRAMVEMAVNGYGGYLLLFAGLFLLLLYFWRRAVNRVHIDPWHGRPSLAVRIPLLVVMLALIVLGVRGSIVSKPIKPVYAFEHVTLAEGQLALNGVFTAFHALNGRAGVEVNFFPWNEAVATVQSLLASDHERYTAAGFPLMRKRSAATRHDPQHHRQPNIVVLLLESWDFEHLDATRRLAGLEPYNVTPNFNRLAEEGLLFTRFYANGQRSIDAIAALLTGIPAIPGSGYLGEGVETNRFTWLGRLAKAEGYSTIMLQGSRRASFYLDKIAPLAGFDRYLGAEDFSPSLHDTSRTPAWGGWDYDLLMKAHEQFAAADKPFAGFVFTVSTHVPYGIPDDRWKRYPEKSDEECYLNSLHYADWALGEFFRKAKESGYFDNTIFILTADHVAGFSRNADIETQHHVPALIVAPGITPGISESPGSQIDLIPTLIDLAGWNSAYAGIGTSLLDESTGKGAFIRRGGIIGRIEGGNLLLHNLHEQVQFKGDKAAAEAMQKRLLSTMQVVDGLLKSNRVVSP